LSRDKDRPASKHVRMSIPFWMTGGEPLKLQDLCGWQMLPVPGPGNHYMVRTKDAEHGRSSRFITMTKLADSRNCEDSSVYSRMRRLRPLEHMVPEDLGDIAYATYQRLEEKYPGEPTAALMSMQALIAAAPSTDDAMSLLQRTFTDWILPGAPNASCHLIEVAETLGYRYSVTRALLNVRNPKPTGSARESRDLVFGSALGLFGDTTLGLSAYLDCMATSLSPDVWAFPIPRPGGVVLLIFGGATPGQSDLPLDKIQLFSPSMNTVSRYRPDPGIAPDDFTKAAQWWVSQLTTMFSVATEPANHMRHGAYDPSMAVEKLLTLEQVFRDCQSIATITRDQHARLTLAFQVFTRLKGLVPSLEWKKLVGLNAARKTLMMLQTVMPLAIQPILLPRAERAVEALEEMGGGFFLANAAGEDAIRLPAESGNGKEELVPRSRAVTEWLQLYRNSLHGFDRPTTSRHQALLAAHDGTIPGALADLAWLHLLGLLAKPGSLARFRALDSKD
jgi:hypothetical protein